MTKPNFRCRASHGCRGCWGWRMAAKLGHKRPIWNVNPFWTCLCRAGLRPWVISNPHPIPTPVGHNCLKCFFHLSKVARKGMDSEWRSLEVIRLPPSKQLHHVLEVKQAVVHRCGSQKENVPA